MHVAGVVTRRAALSQVTFAHSRIPRVFACSVESEHL